MVGGPDGLPGLIARVIAACAANRWLTLIFVAAAMAWGVFAVRHTNLDAIPDLSDTQVIVFTEWPGRSPDLLEDQITFPISTTLLAAPGVRSVRGQSFFGLSFVYAIFEDGTDLYWARSRVLEYLSTAQGSLPEGVIPTLGPDATGVGWVFQYALVDRSGRYDLADLRGLQDWNLRYALEAVPGVAEVASLGGFVRQYQVNVDPNRLLALGVSLPEVVAAVRESNEDVGGRVIEIAGHEHMIRGRGYVRSVADLEEVALRASADGTPVRLRDVAEISLGPDMRRGVAELDGEGEVVGGIVVMRFGENALAVIDAVERRIEEIRPGLPEGVELVITYDRSELIRESIGTLRRTLWIEMIVVSLVIFFFLLHARSALIPILTIPIGVLLAFVPMFYQGLTANIMSLGGIAVAIGGMVDAAIIIVENIHRRLQQWSSRGGEEPREAVILRAMQEVGPSVFFALLVIMISFLPVFALEGASGRLFQPLAFTKTYAMAFAAILSVTLVPALAAMVIRGRIRAEEQHPLNLALVGAYAPVVRFVVDHRLPVIGAALLVLASGVFPLLRIGTEFMPSLNEGVLLYMPTAPPGISITEATAILQRMDRALAEHPEVARVFGKIGRAETPTDPAPLSMVETVILLEPRSAWRKGVTWDDILEELDERVRFPGMPNVWWMPVQTRTEMLATGIRTPVALKVFGDDLASIEQTSIEIERTLAGVPGTRSALADRSTGGFYLDFRVDRAEAARYGLRVRQVSEIIESAIGGMNVSETVEGRERYPIGVRYAREFRDDPEALRRVLVSTPSGTQVPLEKLARIEFTTGPDMIRSEDGRLVGFVSVDVAGRAVVDYVEEARRVIEAQVEIPPGMRTAWAGQFENWERAKRRLFVLVPVTLGIVILLLTLNTGTPAGAAFILGGLPVSLAGSFWLLYLLDYNLSVAVVVGLIALAGLDAQMGVVMLLYLRLATEERQAAGRLRTPEDLREAIVEGAAQRIRPKMMTVLTMVVALTPLLLSAGTGADVMKRIAAPLVGGLAASFALELLVYPAVYAIWKERALARAQREEDGS